MVLLHNKQSNIDSPRGHLLFFNLQSSGTGIFMASFWCNIFNVYVQSKSSALYKTLILHVTFLQAPLLPGNTLSLHWQSIKKSHCSSVSLLWKAANLKGPKWRNLSCLETAVSSSKCNSFWRIPHVFFKNKVMLENLSERLFHMLSVGFI